MGPKEWKKRRELGWKGQQLAAERNENWCHAEYVLVVAVFLLISYPSDEGGKKVAHHLPSGPLSGRDSSSARPFPNIERNPTVTKITPS